MPSLRPDNRPSSSGDDVVIVRFDDNQNWQISPSGENGRDAQAFKLEGQRIPGPAPLALVALGTAILGFRRFDRAFIKPVASSA